MEIRYGRSQYRRDAPSQQVYNPAEVERDMASLEDWYKRNHFMGWNEEDRAFRASVPFYGDRATTVDHQFHGQFWYTQYEPVLRQHVWRYDAGLGFAATFALFMIFGVVFMFPAIAIVAAIAR